MTSLVDLLRTPPDLPVVGSLERIRVVAARPGSAMILTAPPGTGKTTLLPPALAAALGPEQKVVVTQPRRVAVRAAARRISSVLHESLGATVGYTVRGDSQTSAATRIEMVTPGVLLRRLQRDPELPGVGAVVLDEFHERQLDTDLALALLLDVRANVREDLVLALTSATLEAERTASLVAHATGVEPARIEVPGFLYPLEVRWAPPPHGAEPLGTSGAEGRIGVRREFLGHVARTIRSTAASTRGDVLVFLPGAREIDAVRALLTREDADAEILTLHGSLSPAEQDRVLSGGVPPSSPAGARRRIILSTAIAESSLTVPGIRVVIDAGLSREPRMDVARGIAMLVTVPASRARSEQRAGRAARLGPGIVVRCLAQADWARRPLQSQPEIATSDLTDAVLQCAVWGNPAMSGLPFLDPPPSGALEAASTRLRSVGAIDEDGRATSLGRRLALLPVDPLLGRALLEAAPRIGAQRAATFVALLAEDTRAPGADLFSLARQLARGGADPVLRDRVRVQERRLEALTRQVSSPAVSAAGGHSPHVSTPSGRVHATTRAPRGEQGDSPLGDEDALALVVALAHPAWIARKRPGTDRYLLADGLGAALSPSSPLSGQEWLAVAEIQRGQGRADGVIRAAVPLDAADAEWAGVTLLHENIEANLRGGRVQARTTRRLGAIELSGHQLDRVPQREGAAVIAAALAREGLDLLPWPPAAQSLRHRLAALHDALGAPWPDVSDRALIARMRDEGWLGEDLDRVARGGALSQVDTTDGLRALLAWPEATHLDEFAPQRLLIPTGAMRAVDWSGNQPVLSLRVQEAFGWLDTPRVAAGRLPVVLHLLDPAGRPVAVTSDLRSFWAGPYRDVRAQLRGRYPRHPWPENPLEATPTSQAATRHRPPRR